MFGHWLEVVLKYELLNSVCLTWRLEQKVGPPLAPLNEAEMSCMILLFNREIIFLWQLNAKI